MIRFTIPFNALGWPALSLPAGGGSIQLVARQGADALVLAAGRALERTLGHVEETLFALGWRAADAPSAFASAPVRR